MESGLTLNSNLALADIFIYRSDVKLLFSGFDNYLKKKGKNDCSTKDFLLELFEMPFQTKFSAHDSTDTDKKSTLEFQTKFSAHDSTDTDKKSTLEFQTKFSAHDSTDTDKKSTLEFQTKFSAHDSTGTDRMSTLEFQTKFSAHDSTGTDRMSTLDQLPPQESFDTEEQILDIQIDKLYNYNEESFLSQLHSVTKDLVKKSPQFKYKNSLSYNKKDIKLISEVYRIEDPVTLSPLQHPCRFECCETHLEVCNKDTFNDYTNKCPICEQQTD
jgi:hypothetical protein